MNSFYLKRQLKKRMEGFFLTLEILIRKELPEGTAHIFPL